MNYKFLIIFTLSILSFIVCGFKNIFQQANQINLVKGKTFHELFINSLDGKSKIDFNQFKGKKVLCVNVASACGYTYQYEGLENLHRKYKEKLIVVGFPCNQFGGQEPGSAEEILDFCNKKYGVTFVLSEKIDVRGEKQHPVYQWLCQQTNNGSKDVEVKWNFGKFLIDENGEFVEYFSSKIKPEDEEIIKYLR